MRVKYLTVQQGKLNNIGSFPNFHRSGSIIGMKSKFYGKNVLLVRCGQWIYNVPKRIYDLAK